jgi:hypothetical protein
MKAAVVFALLVLCAFAVEIPKKVPKIPKFPKIPKVNRDDPTVQYFKNDVGCQFTAEWKEYDSHYEKTGIKGDIAVGGNHSMISYKEKETVSGYDVEYKYKYFQRFDIKKDGNILDVQTYSYDMEDLGTIYACTNSWYDPEQYMYGISGSYRYILTEELPYDTIAKDQKFGDKTFDVYCYGETFCWGVKDKKVYALEGGEGFYVIDDYEDEATKDDFTISKKYFGEESLNFCDTEAEKAADDPENVPESCELADAASTVQAVAAIVLAMMVLFF